jgi:uncharacterized alpha-E superfamily protein
MLSRIADALYWMSRYLERADHTARMININCIHMLEAEDTMSEDAQWRPLLTIVGGSESYLEKYPDGSVSARRVAQFMVQEGSNHGSLYSSLRLARENARIVRDRISLPMWETINELWLFVDREIKHGPAYDHRLADRLHAVGREVARFQGLAVNTMERGEAFGFYLLGTFVERADMMARLLDVKYHILLPEHSSVGSALDYYQWAALLKSITGFETYRRKYRSEINPVEVAELVILDADFPRSLLFSVQRMSDALRQLGNPAKAQRCETAVAELRKQLDTTSAKIFSVGLHESLEVFLESIARVDAAVQREYFQFIAEAHECST